MEGGFHGIKPLDNNTVSRDMSTMSNLHFHLHVSHVPLADPSAAQALVVRNAVKHLPPPSSSAIGQLVFRRLDMAFQARARKWGLRSRESEGQN